jgi:hypothetical protein
VKYILALIVAFAFAAPINVHAHGTQKGPNGGPMEDVAGVHVELIAKGQTIVLNIFDESNKPLATKGFTASALISAGADKETISLAPQGENTLQGELKKAISPGATISVTLKTAAGKSGQARFKQ